MHLHLIENVNPDTGEPIMSPKHVLNIWQLPAMDDGNLVVKAEKGKFKGKWDDSDQVDRTPDDGSPNVDSTFPLTQMVDELCDEKIFLMVHGIDKDASTLPGFLKGPLKLTNQGEKVCNKQVDDDDEWDD